MSDEARKILLSRRARFIAAAIAGIGAASTDACKPMVCLEPVPPAEDAGADAAEAGPAKDGGVLANEGGEVPPQPCLSQTPPDASDRK